MLGCSNHRCPLADYFEYIALDDASAALISKIKPFFEEHYFVQSMAKIALRNALPSAKGASKALQPEQIEALRQEVRALCLTTLYKW